MLAYILVRFTPTQFIIELEEYISVTIGLEFELDVMVLMGMMIMRLVSVRYGWPGAVETHSLTA